MYHHITALTEHFCLGNKFRVQQCKDDIAEFVLELSVRAVIGTWDLNGSHTVTSGNLGFRQNSILAP